MEASNKVLDLFKALAEQLPSLLTLLACMIFAIARWKRHPKVSLVVLISLGLLFFHVLVFSIVYNWVPDWFIRSATAADIESVSRNVFLVLGLIASSTRAVGFGLLLTAIFMLRKPRPQT